MEEKSWKKYLWIKLSGQRYEYFKKAELAKQTNYKESDGWKLKCSLNPSEWYFPQEICRPECMKLQYDS